jgi:large subunit ribosomal protein L24e
MKCSFCRRELPPIGALLFVKKTGDTLNFCSSKCEKSFFMGRNPRKKQWVRKEKKKKSPAKAPAKK